MIDLTQEINKYKFFQNKECPFFPFDDNDNACHPESDPETHNCLFCFCPLYSLNPKDCPEDADPIVLEDGTKDCSKCLYPHKPENYEDMMDKLKEI